MKRLRHRAYKGIIIVAGICVILLATLYLLRGVVVAPHIQRLLEKSIESQLGMEVAIGKFGGSYVTNFELTNVTTLKASSTGVWVSLELKRLRVSYDLLSLFKGLNAFLEDAAVELDAAKLTLDLSRGKAKPHVSPKADSQEPIFLPELLPRIHIEDTTVYLRGSDYETAFKGLGLDTRSRGQMSSTIQLRIREWSWMHPKLQAGKTPVTAEIEYSAEKLAAHRLMLGKSELVEFMQIGLKRLPEAIPFEAMVHLAGGRLKLNGKLDASNLSGQIEAVQLDLAKVGSFFQPELALEGIISMKGAVTLPMERPTDLRADLDLKLNRGNVYGLSADAFTIKAAAEDGKIRVDQLNLQTGKNLIKFLDVTSSLQAVFGGDLEGILQTLAGTMSLDCQDVVAFFSLAGVDLPSGIEAVSAHRLMLDGEIRDGDINFSGGSLTTDSGHIRLGPSRFALPSMNRPIMDTEIQVALDIDLPDLKQIGRLFKVPQLGGAVQAHATVTGTIAAPSGTANIAARGISFMDMNYGDLAVKAVADSKVAVIESLTLRRGKDHLNGRGSFHLANQTLADVQLDFHFSDLAFYFAELWPENWNVGRGKPHISGSLTGKAALNGPLTMPSGSADLNLQDITFEGNQFGDAALRLQSKDQKITVATLNIRQAKDRLKLKGSFDLESKIFENVQLNFAIADIAAYTKNLLPDSQTLAAAVHASLDVSGPLQEPQGRADIALKSVQFNDIKVPSAAFKLRSSGRRIDIDLVQIKDALGEVKLTGYLVRAPADAAFDLAITDLTISRQNARLALDRPGNIHFSPAGQLSLKNISLNGPNGGIRLDGTLDAQRKVALDLIISEFSSQGWFNSLVTDRLHFSGLNARLHLSGFLKNPSLSVVGDLAKLDNPQDQMSLSGRFDLSYTPDGLHVRQFQWQGGPGQQIVLAGKLPVNILKKPILRPGPLSVTAEIFISDLTAFSWVLPDHIPLDGDFQGNLQISGTWNAPSGSFIFRSRGLNDPPHMKSMPPGPIGVEGSVRIDGKKLVVESIQMNSSVLSFNSKGRWNGMPAVTDLLQGKIAKPTGNVALQGNLKVADLSWLAAQNPGLRRAAGRLEANLTLQGPISDPKVDAVLRLADGELRPDIDLPSLQALNLDAVATPAGVQLNTFTGELGGAAFQVMGSVLRNRPSGAAADLRLQGENLLFYRSEGLKLRADTDLTVRGPVKRLTVAGDVAITDGRLVKYFDLLGIFKGSSKPKTDMGLQLFSIRNPPLSAMGFDVRLTSKNPFKVRNNLVRGAVRPELKLTGTGEFPVLSGIVYVDPTRVRLPAGSLVFESGVIRFDPNRPDRPTLDLFGTSKMLGYEITVLVEGPYDEPVVTLSSVPPLSNDELLLLLIAGQQPNSEDDPKASQRQSMNVAVFFSRDLLSRWFGSDSVEVGESIFDRFEVGIGRAVTRSGEDTIEAQFRIADGVLRDGDKLYITGEKDIFDFYNAGLKIVFRFK